MRLKIPLGVSIMVFSALALSSVYAEPITNVAPTPYSAYYKGDPYTTVYSPSEILPSSGAISPKIEIKSIANNSVTASSNLTLSFNLILESPTTYYPITLQGLCYKPSWQTDNITIDFGPNNKFYNKTLPFDISLANITDGGVKTVTIYASVMYENETGRKNVEVTYGPGVFLKGYYLYIYSEYYFIEGSSSVDFTIDTSPSPSVPEFSWLTILPLLLAIPMVLIIFRKSVSRHRK